MASGMMAISTVIMAHSLPIHILIPLDLYHGVPTMIEQVFIPFGTNQSISYERVDMRDPTKDLTNVLQRLSNNEARHQAEEDTEHENTEKTKTKTKKNIIVWLETPSNPLCHIIDIAHTCHIIRSNSHELNTTIVVDSTLAPPNITQPLLITPTSHPTVGSDKVNTTGSTVQLRKKQDDDTTITTTTTDCNHPPVDGVDVVIHSGTKYIGGHSDTMGGIITVSPWTVQGQALLPNIQQIQVHQGGIVSSMDSYLMIRGLRTLHVRVERQSQSAFLLAKYIQDQMYLNEDGLYSTYIKQVYYPGLSPPPPPKLSRNVGTSNWTDEQQQQQQQQQQQYEIATQQMRNGVYGCVLSLEFHTAVQAMAFIGGLQIFVRATSFGGTESLIEHRASIEPPELRTSPDGLVRISVGLENVNDLINDIQNAMRIMDIVCKNTLTSQ
jgi:cystathionine gamma-synthase